MADSTQVPSSLHNLGDTIRAIEKESGQASQLIVKVGDGNYLIGDLTARIGEYRLEMDDNYTSNFDDHQQVSNPYRELAGTYKSFDELRQGVKSGNQNTREIGDFHKGPHLIGTWDQVYSVVIPGMNLGRGGGQTYIRIGKIIFPLLQDGENLEIRKLE